MLLASTGSALRLRALDPEPDEIIKMDGGQGAWHSQADAVELGQSGCQKQTQVRGHQACKCRADENSHAACRGRKFQKWCATP